MPSLSLYLSPANLQYLDARGGHGSARLVDLILRGLAAEAAQPDEYDPLDDLDRALTKAREAVDALMNEPPMPLPKPGFGWRPRPAVVLTTAPPTTTTAPPADPQAALVHETGTVLPPPAPPPPT